MKSCGLIVMEARVTIPMCESFQVTIEEIHHDLGVVKLCGLEGPCVIGSIDHDEF